MRANGWRGKPVDVVRMPDGRLVTVDNSRVLAAHEAGIDVRAVVHSFDDAIPPDLAARFVTAKGGLPTTWGDALLNRIGNQNAAYRSAWPQGSPLTGWQGS